MKNIKRKLRYTVMVILIFMMSAYVGQAAVSAGRTIDSNMLTAGSVTNVTVVIQNDITQALALQEIVPPGFVITRISDDANDFRASTGEWIWITVANNATKTVKYKITVPSDTAAGIYGIKGNISTTGNTKNVAGDYTITVTSSGRTNSGSSSGSSDGNPAETTAPINGSNVVPMEKTVSPATIPQSTVSAVEQTVQPLVTAGDTPVTMAKPSPGFEIVAAIGIFGVIYMSRKMK